MVFEKPVSFETAIGLLEVSGFGELDDVPEIEQEQVLDYNVGVLIEGNIGEIPDHSRIN